MASRTTMNISVTPEIEKFVHALVASGRFGSASEVFREALRMLEDAEHQRLLERWLTGELSDQEAARLPKELLDAAKGELRAMVREGIEAARRGELHDAKDVFKELRAHAARRRSRSA